MGIEGNYEEPVHIGDQVEPEREPSPDDDVEDNEFAPESEGRPELDFESDNA